jgi:hypothetical protein
MYVLLFLRNAAEDLERKGKKGRTKGRKEGTID